MKLVRHLLRWTALLATALAASAQAAPDTIRIGVATAGGGDPVTWGGSPGGVARANNWLEEEFKASGIKVSGCSSRARARP